MTNQNRTEFAKLCALMSEAFGKPMSEMLIDIYFDGLKDFEIEQVTSAVQQAVKSRTFMPKIAELCELIGGSASDHAELAWRTFIDLVKFEGSYPSLQIYDGGIAYAIECMGGWCSACEKISGASPEMLASHEKNFKASYKLGLVRDEKSAYLIGAVEADNRTLGQWKEPTVNQPVCLVRPGKVVKVVMPLDVAEGRLTDEARAALQSGGEALKKYLPAPTKPVKALPSGGGMATAEEVAQLKAQIKSAVPSQRNGLTLIKPTRGE